MTALVNSTFTTVKNLSTDFAGSWDAWLHYYGVETPVGGYQLNVPAGSYTAGRMACANHQAIIQGAGIDQTLVFIDGLNSQAGSDHGLVPRINSVSAGSTTVTLKVPSEHTKYTVGFWYQPMGWAMQNFGFPPNNQFFEYHRVIDKNTVTGVITLDAPLENSYSDTWPFYTVGSDSTFDSDTGGAACLHWYMTGNGDGNNPLVGQFHTDRQWWTQTLTIRDLTVSNGPGDIWFGQGGIILWERVAFNGFAGTASSSPSWTFRNCIFRGDSIEIDKSVVELAFYNTQFNNASGGTGAGINFQSSSVKHLTMDGCTFLSTGLFCQLGAKTFDVSNCTFGPLAIGPSSYGACERGSITNCSAVSVFDVASRFCTPAGLTYSAGVFTIPYASIDGTDTQLDLTPGTASMMGSARGTIKCFTILSVTQPSPPFGDVLYTTDLPAVLPELALSGTFRPHGCRRITISGCTGALAPYNGTTNEPLFTRYTITQTGNDAAVYGGLAFGTLVSITVEVIQAYTGVHGTIFMCPLGQFGSVFLYAGAHNVIGAQYQPNINLNITGTRVIMSGSTTGTQSGDSIPALAAGDNWLIVDTNGASGIKGHINNGSIGTGVDISAESSAVRPIVRITVVCNQGI